MSQILLYFTNLNLTDAQSKVAVEVEAFLKSCDPVFLLKGYAGTGKTTLLRGICQYTANTLKRDAFLMAPTGRAAQVLSEKTKVEAKTIHKSIYSFHDLDTIETVGEEGGELFRFVYKLRSDADIVNQVFIVDEGSMLSDVDADSEFFRFGSGRVLHDLLQFGKIGQPNVRTQLLIVGDPAQLPPVGMAFSPALDEQYFADTYKLNVRTAELRDVVRQGGQSGVLELATNVRRCITANRFTHFAVPDNGIDVKTLSWAAFMSAYQQASTRKVVICYKNKTAKDLSECIRKERFGPKAPVLQKGDLVVAGMNNIRLGVMNGTFGMIAEVTDQVVERSYTLKRSTGPVSGTLRWRWVEVMFRGDNGSPYTLSTWLFENFLLSDHSRLDSIESQALFVDFVIRYRNETGQRSTKTNEFREALRNDPFVNALMVKYGYAVTCHKAQGSEWPDVLICFDYSKVANFNPYQDKQTEKELTNSDFYRWAYTAITRASSRLLALNPPSFSVFSKLSWIDTVLANEFMATQGVETHMILWGTKEDQWLEQLGLIQRNDSVQQKLIEVWHRLQRVGVVIKSITEKPFQEHLALEQAGKLTRAVLYFDGKHQIKSHMMLGGDQALASLVDHTLKQPVNIVVEREVLSDLAQSSLHYTPVADQPQLQILFDEITQFGQEKDVRIANVTPMLYRERYSFERGTERAVVDFVYDDQGFFKEARPLAKHCKGQALLNDLHKFVLSLRK
ncbi:hypothetical protein GCM10023187_09390 [Nibrella viscosa]|uniref:UvrD-like helicase C-terminal domain-containing protein n=1 Tax=Nibrella viscosa TaxID=1084524 RepID=A0ABP8JZX6_9BACT